MNNLRDKWNLEFESGKWNFLRKDDEQVRLKCVAQLVQRHISGWDAVPLVDLGSGEGHLSHWLDKDKISRYVAVDISDVALENIIEDAIPVTRVSESLAGFAPDDELRSGPLVLVANEVLYYEPDSVDQLRRIAEAQQQSCLVVISSVGPHPDKPNWTASSKRLWSEIDQLGWLRLETQQVRDDATNVVWDIVAFEVVPKKKR